MNVYLASALTQCVIQTIQMLHSLCLWKCACDGQETKVPNVVAGGPLRKLAGQGAKVPNVVAGGPLRKLVGAGLGTNVVLLARMAWPGC